MPNCYSQRMLNPFHGIANVIEIAGADAVSRDGETWTLFVHGEREVIELEDGSRQEVESPDVKFGVWSARQGLRRAPIRNTVDYEFVDHVGRYLLEVIRHHLDSLPFPLRDSYELWLLDSAFELPLALLDSRCSPGETDDGAPRTWHAGMMARQHFQVSDTLEKVLDGANPAECLEQIVNRAAGPRPRARWFVRRGDLSGRAIGEICTEQEAVSRPLPADAFPEQLLRSHWPNRSEEALVRAYLDWQAPWLLMLQHLTDATRDRLERAAGQRAMLLVESHGLFPKVIDMGRIIAARVEARLRRAAGEGREYPSRPDELLPFFNE